MRMPEDNLLDLTRSPTIRSVREWLSMTLEELDETLPNGLHDARIKALTHDFENATVRIVVEVLVGLPSDPPQDQFRYRTAEVLFDKVLFCSVEAPENERILGHPGSIWFKFWLTEPGTLQERIVRVLPQDSLCYSIYILEWESQIQIAAGGMSFRWAEPDRSTAAE
jgi:hypothetical protein